MDPSLLTLRRFQRLQVSIIHRHPSSAPGEVLAAAGTPLTPQKSSEQSLQQGQRGGIISRPFFLGKVALGHSSSKDFSFSAAPDVALLHLCPNEAVINYHWDPPKGASTSQTWP